MSVIRNFIRIVDADTNGHLNVDDIIESYEQSPLAVEPRVPPSPLQDLGPRPNPFNPRTELRFALAADAEVRVREYVYLNNDFDSDVDDANNHAVMRSRVGLNFEAGDYVSAYIQFQDTRGLGEPATTTTSRSTARGSSGKRK